MKGSQKSFLLSLFVSAILAASCLQGQNSPGARTIKNSGDSTGDGTINPGAGEGTPTVGITPAAPSVELTHIFDPISQTYKQVVNLPKNYGKFLYLSGKNISTLSGQFLRVKFYFGTDRTQITLDATVGRNPEAKPNTDSEVLILDLSTKPFDNLLLLYDLFDYNQYADSDVPYTDPSGPGLYCRGLLLEDDPTFSGDGVKTACDASGDICLYAYAKIRDRGLTKVDTNAIQEVSLPAIDLTGGGYDNEDRGLKIHKCLPDNGKVYYKLNGGTLDLTADTTQSLAGYGTDVLTMDSINYQYYGPYQTVSYATTEGTDWQIGTAAAIYMPSFPGTASYAPRGLFADSLNGTVEAGIQSYLFPRAGKLTLKKDVTYLGSATTPLVTSQRTLQTMLSNTTTEVMDGCNLRASYTDFGTLNTIASCNITAYIELYTYDPTTKLETIIFSNQPGSEINNNSSNTSRFMKLQLIRPSSLNTNKVETLQSSFKSCKNSNACAKDECCYNQHCWSSSLVPQCIESGLTNGLKSVGETCDSDFKCISLCCGTSGTCQVHNPSLDTPVLCSKAPGASCVAKEWCRQESISVCKVYRVGVTPTGSPTCALRCIPTPTYGECIGGICQPVVIPTPETFDPTDTNACASAPEFPDS